MKINLLEIFKTQDHQAIAAFYDFFLMANVRFKNMVKSLENYTKYVYFENMFYQEW